MNVNLCHAWSVMYPAGIKYPVPEIVFTSPYHPSTNGIPTLRSFLITLINTAASGSVLEPNHH